MGYMKHRKSTKRKSSRRIVKVKKKSKLFNKKNNLGMLFKYGYSFEKKSMDRLNALIKYIEKFGIKKAMSELSKIISYFIYDNKISKIIIADLKNIRNWFIKINKKGGAEISKKSSTSSILDKLGELTNKLQKTVSRGTT